MITEIFLGVYRPKGDGGEVIIRRSKVDREGMHAAVEILRLPTGPGYEWSHVAPAIAEHGFVVEPRSNWPVGHGDNFFFNFRLLKEEHD